MNPVAVITGTTHGIGRVTARELAGAGYRVVMLCRDLPAAEAVSDEIRRQHPGATVRAIQCDLASLASVRAAARTVRGECPCIDLLINNAGLVSSRHRMSADGLELMFAVNHLAHFLLVRLLREQLAPQARIINVASRAHLRGRLDLASIADPRARFRPTQAYAQSKLANVLFTFALARRLAGTEITTNCLHPGVVATHLLPAWLRLVKPLLSPQILDVERGARTTLYLALSAEVAGVSGRYFDEHQQVQPASPLADDLALQESLWNASERWIEARK